MNGSDGRAGTGGVSAMTFAPGIGLRFNSPGSEIRVSEAGKPVGLDAAEQRALSDWLDQAGSVGIEAVLDLAGRPWNIPGTPAIFGVFECDKDRASWLIVRSYFGWTLARCADGLVSEASALLPDILGLIDDQCRM